MRDRYVCWLWVLCPKTLAKPPVPQLLLIDGGSMMAAFVGLWSFGPRSFTANVDWKWLEVKASVLTSVIYETSEISEHSNKFIYLDNFWSFKRTNWLVETTSPSLPVLFILQSSFLKHWKPFEEIENFFRIMFSLTYDPSKIFIYMFIQHMC